MTAMTFESIHGTPRRAAARRSYPAVPRSKSVPTPPVAITAGATTTDSKRSWDRYGIFAGAASVIALHVVVIAAANRPMVIASTPHKLPSLTFDIALPPPPPVSKPKPLPQIAEAKPVVRQQPTSLPVVQNISTAPGQAVETVQVAVAAPPMLSPVITPEPITEPRGYAGYLNNPAPSYPLVAQKHGLQGKVILKIHVLTSGQPDNVTVAKSSGYSILDEAAVKSVAAWVFEPAKRGKTPIDGWVNVPINFNLS